jgi:hypothetical protein
VQCGTQIFINHLLASKDFVSLYDIIYL